MTDVRRWLLDRVAEICSLAPDEIDIDRPLREYGIRSVDAISMSGRLEELLDRPIDVTVFWEHPTIRALADELGQTSTRPAARSHDVRTESGQREDRIALIGIGCRLPGGISSVEDFWAFLAAGGDGVSEVPPQRWAPYRSSPEQAAVLERSTVHGGYLADIDGFDAEHFGIPPAEAAEMDPQQRLLLEVAWEALEHAGIAADNAANGRTGVFIGACSDDHARRKLEWLPAISAWSGTGAALSIIANRLSYLLDLRGPSMTVDSACSSSLLAMHLARRSLLSGESDLALVGGVNVLLSPGITVNFDLAGVLSPDGRCKPFSAAADGYGRGEGAVVVVAKRLGDAMRDGDRVLAVLAGSETNSDGRSNGLMAPNPRAQADLLERAYRESGIAPGDVDYVEAHGTGTVLGDAIEAEALGRVLGGAHRSRSLLVGSVKSNLGHLEAAAGIAGLAKCALAVYRRQVPPTIHHQQPSPRIPFDRLGLRVATQAVDLPTDRPIVAGVSSFGFGGTNVHAVLTSGPARGET
ncbi:type I polyketide synthase [Actinokineospora xionganensis]|uniref:Polyketide synthase n=1 Tax=Actinokineospora xionganensis TaxID=2684470 RepID=A0ABR7L009_9PSEU|nr:type I polyketide synthase [Actinokineospora xionganensis]MBC6445965.1 hypothetical protein [Actinokineospora xionganensis]